LRRSSSTPAKMLTAQTAAQAATVALAMIRVDLSDMPPAVEPAALVSPPWTHAAPPVTLQSIEALKRCDADCEALPLCVCVSVGDHLEDGVCALDPELVPVDEGPWLDDCTSDRVDNWDGVAALDEVAVCEAEALNV
jgi:hypothetical protein